MTPIPPATPEDGLKAGEPSKIKNAGTIVEQPSKMTVAHRAFNRRRVAHLILWLICPSNAKLAVSGIPIGDS